LGAIAGGFGQAGDDCIPRVIVANKNRGQSFFLALLAAVAAWHELVLLAFR
jgi:hypothetical protein